jgi:hypothetical protein
MAVVTLKTAATPTATASATATATSAATASAAATAATASAVFAASTHESAAAVFLVTCFAHRQAAAIDIFAVERSNRCLRFLIASHFNETEAFGAPGIAVIDDLGGSDGAIGGEYPLEVAAAHGVTQIADVEFLAQRRRSNPRGLTKVATRHDTKAGARSRSFFYIGAQKKHPPRKDPALTLMVTPRIP